MRCKHYRISKEYPENGSCHRCKVCEYQNLKELENNPVIRVLQDKIELLNFRLSECKNENQILLRNLKLAKKKKRQDTARDETHFQNFSKSTPECRSKGQKETLNMLKANVQKLKDCLKQLEGESPTTSQVRSEEFSKYIFSDRKRLWRLQLEYRLARENSEKDINSLIQQSFELRKSVDREKNRFKGLNEEIQFLQTAMKNQIVKCKHDVRIMHSFKSLENQLQKTVNESEEIRQDLKGCQARNKRLTKDIVSLKGEIEILQKKSEDSSTLIDSLATFHKNMQEAIDNEKTIVLQSVDHYSDELRTLKENCGTNDEMLDHVQRIIYDRSALLDILKSDIAGGFRKDVEGEKLKLDDICKPPVKVTHMFQSHLSEFQKTNIASENEEQDNDKSNSDTNVRNVRVELVKYKVLSDAAQMESEYLQHIFSVQETMMSFIGTQVLDTGILLRQMSLEEKKLHEKIKKLQRSLAIKRQKGQFYVQQKNKLEELWSKIDVQTEENDYLRNLLRSTLCSKFKDLQLVKHFTSDIKGLFQASLYKIKNSIEFVQNSEN